MTSSADRTARERRAARRAALRAVHPDLGGDTEAFIDAMRAFEQSHAAGPVVTTTLRSRTARRARRARRRLRSVAGRRPGSWPGRHYTYLSEERA
jgi:hypothetical protein